MEGGRVYPIFILKRSERIIPFITRVADSAVDVFEASPAAKIPCAVSFGKKFYDTFLFDSLEKIIMVTIFVSGESRQIAAVTYAIH